MALADTLVWGKLFLCVGSALTPTVPELGYLRSLQLAEAVTLRMASCLGTVAGRQAGGSHPGRHTSACRQAPADRRTERQAHRQAGKASL